AAPRFKWAGRGDGEPAPALRIENGGEDRGAVEARPAEPVARSEAGDERGGPAISNDGVIVDLRFDHPVARCCRAPSRASSVCSSNQRAWESLASASRSSGTTTATT